MRYVNPYNYDCADDFWDAVAEEIEREEARADDSWADDPWEGNDDA